MTDMEILKKAYEIEYGEKDKTERCFAAWESYQVGATRSDITRLKDAQFIRVSSKLYAGQDSVQKYRLTDKGINLVKGYLDENEDFRITAVDVLKTMDLVIGFDDIKLQIAQLVESRRRAHVLLDGPPACAKSVILEALRAAVPNSYLAFGSRTSAAGISDKLFELKPTVLLLDEADKMNKDMYSVLLGLMQSGEIIETKSRKTRGVILNTQVYAACNGSSKFTQELLSRFIHFHFPHYTRQEFIEVCCGYLSRAEKCPLEIATIIGQMVFDYNLGDVRRGRQIWMLMNAPTESEVERVVQLMLKYGPDVGNRRELVKPRKRLL